MKKLTKTTFMLALLLLGGLYLGFSSNQTASAATLDSDVEPGNTYYFDVTDFPTFQDLIDLSGVNDNSNVTVSATGGLQGSQIYVKVIDTDTSSMRYWDGSNLVTTTAPVTDLSVGMITGSQITLTVTNDTSGETITDQTIPAGLGLPVPFIFGSTSYLNVSNVETGILPLPFALNDDYATHETVGNQLIASLPGGSGGVTNDGSQFKISVSNVPLDENSTVQLTGHVAWSKPDGVAQEVNLSFTNSTTGTELVSIDIDRNDADFEYNPINVAVGDHYNLTLEQADFTPSTSGFPSDQDPFNDLQNTKNQLNSFVGEVLIEFDVVEVDGMYYRIEGTTFNSADPNGDRTEIGVTEDIWMVGFGRYGPGMPLPTGTTTGYTTTSPRLNAIPGPIISHDAKIYQAWDATMAFALSSSANLFVDTLELVEEQDPWVEFYHSDGSDVPSITTGFTSSSDDITYTYGIDASVDMMIWSNDSYFGHEQFSNTTVQASADLDVTYERTHFSNLLFTANVNLDRVEYNSTHGTYLDASIGLNDIVFEISGVYDNVVPEPGPDSPEDTTSPLLPLPGFEMYLTIFSITLVGLLVRKQRQ